MDADRENVNAVSRGPDGGWAGGMDGFAVDDPVAVEEPVDEAVAEGEVAGPWRTTW